MIKYIMNVPIPKKCVPHWKLYLYSICQKWTNKMRDLDKIHVTKRTI